VRFHIHDPVNDDRWMAAGNCRGVDPDGFFPERGASTDDAKAICAGCTVRDECLEYAIGHNIKFGIWGGKTIKQRRLIARERRNPGEAA
jgi:WhiB family transcriptional regulator, redox-sensing transcriptional regulator